LGGFLVHFAKDNYLKGTKESLSIVGNDRRVSNIKAATHVNLNWCPFAAYFIMCLVSILLCAIEMAS
jgi:hypothetical protein